MCLKETLTVERPDINKDNRRQKGHPPQKSLSCLTDYLKTETLIMTAIGGKISPMAPKAGRRDSDGMQDVSIKFHARDFLVEKQEDLLQDYDLGDMLGEGGFGLVYSCIHKETGAERAVKILRKDPSRPNYNDNIINEYNVLKELDHPVRYVNYI